MFPRFIAPVTTAVAAAVVVALSALTAAPSAHAAPAASKAAAQKQTLRQFKLSTGIVDGKMVYIDAQTKSVNPVLKAQVGDTVEITVASGEGAQHDIAIPQLKLASKMFDASTGPTTLRFKLTQAGSFTYVCTVPGHQQAGMVGTLEVAGPADAALASAVPAALAAKTAAKTASATKAGPAAAATAANTGAPSTAALPPAAADAVSITMDPAAVPAAIGKRAPQLVKYSIDTVELNGKLDDGSSFNYWTFDRKVPGPMLRVKKGDTIELTLSNPKSSKNIHSIDLHAATGGHGGGQHTQVAPGESKTVRFKAMNAGLYVYHCATPSVPHHISAGMYGLILVEPEEGLTPVDREYYVMQGDLYTGHAAGTKGHHSYSHERASDELPTFYTFNGAVGSLTKEFKLRAQVGETVRIYFGVGGPNKVSSFHVIGEIFDKVYSEGSISTVKRDVQTTLVAPGGATITEFKVDYPGTFLLVDHALSRVGKGLAGVLEVTGTADAAVYQPLGTAAANKVDPAAH